MSVPELGPRCGSWIIVDRANGRPVLEAFSRATASRFDRNRYEVLTASHWLGRLSATIRAGGKEG